MESNWSKYDEDRKGLMATISTVKQHVWSTEMNWWTQHTGLPQRGLLEMRHRFTEYKYTGINAGRQLLRERTRKQNFHYTIMSLQEPQLSESAWNLT